MSGIIVKRQLKLEGHCILCIRIDSWRIIVFICTRRKKKKRRKKRLRNWIRKDDWRVTIFNCIWEDHWRTTVFNCGRKVTVITWCFMPSQPLQLYQGECQKKHTLKNQCIRKSSWRNSIFWKDGWRIIVYNCIRKTAEGSLYVNVWERHLEDHCT